MKILAVSQFFTPDITAAAFRIAETVEDLRVAGTEVEVITTYPHKSEVSSNIETGSSGVHRVSLPDTENKGFLGYIYLYVSFMVKSIAKGLKVGRKQKPDIIWASSPPIFVGLSGWVLARVLGAKLALDIRDIWPDSAVAAGQISDSGFAFKVGKWIEQFLYTHADIITCVAQPMQGYIEKYTDTEVEVIYNGVVTGHQSSPQTAQESVLDDLASNPESRKILYAGNFGHVQQLDLLITAYAEMNKDELQHDWEIFFLGNGVKKDEMKSSVSAYELSDNIHFLDPVPKQEVFDYLSSADVLFIHLMESKVLELTIPSKVFDYMLADRPLLAGIHGEGKQIIDSCFGNATFKSGDLDDLGRAFRKVDENLDEYTGGIQNAELVRETYSRESQSKKLHKIFRKLCDKKE